MSLYVSVTELRLRSIFKLFAFLRHVKAIRKQLETAPGLIRYTTAPKRFTCFQTLSAWESEVAMYDFMRSGAHLAAMKNVKHIASGTRYTRRKVETFPTMKEARAWLDHDMPVVLKK